MGDAAWFAIVALVLSLGSIGGWITAVRRRRRLRVADDPEIQKREAARQAIEKMAKDRRGKKGTIRGQGGGGDDRTAQDAGYGTDFGGGI